jgi:hypothetical protein
VYIRRKEVVEFIINSRDGLGRNQAETRYFRPNSGKMSYEQIYDVVPTALPLTKNVRIPLNAAGSFVGYLAVPKILSTSNSIR